MTVCLCSAVQIINGLDTQTTIFWLRDFKTWLLHTEPALNLCETAFRQIPEVWDNARTLNLKKPFVFLLYFIDLILLTSFTQWFLVCSFSLRGSENADLQQPHSQRSLTKGSPVLDWTVQKRNTAAVNLTERPLCS